MNRYGLSREQTLAWLDSSGLSPTVRAEQIDIPGFAALADNAPSAIIR